MDYILDFERVADWERVAVELRLAAEHADTIARHTLGGTSMVSGPYRHLVSRLHGRLARALAALCGVPCVEVNSAGEPYDDAGEALALLQLLAANPVIRHGASLYTKAEWRKIEAALRGEEVRVRMIVTVMPPTLPLNDPEQG